MLQLRTERAAACEGARAALP